MPSFEQDHHFLLELSNVLEPKEKYTLDHIFYAIDKEIANYEL